jgi:hypothetical protein
VSVLTHPIESVTITYKENILFSGIVATGFEIIGLFNINDGVQEYENGDVPPEIIVFI